MRLLKGRPRNNWPNTCSTSTRQTSIRLPCDAGQSMHCVRIQADTSFVPAHFCTPATLAPVERVFSQSGLMIRPYQARMSDTLPEALVHLKCNVNDV